MYKNKKILALITARGGSKGLPNKNIRFLKGKPLLAWTIDAARECPYLDSIMVSTDSPKIARVARKYKADVPFLRPPHLATDKADIMHVIFHAQDWLKRNKEIYDVIILLQPTSPLRTSQDIANALKLFFAKNADVIISVTKSEHPPLWSNILPSNGCMKNFLKKENQGKNRQNLPTFYRLNGAIYIAKTNYLENERTFFGDKTFAYVMPQTRSVDIDRILDFKLAEVLAKED